MTPKPPLTDRTALLRHRARAKGADKAALFLHHRAILEVQERLEMVNRPFKSPAIVTGHPDLWNPIMPNARMVDDPETLALDPDAHDLIIHAMALHWANDPVGQLIQSRTALKPDGLFLGVFPGGQTLSELRQVFAAAEADIIGGISPRILPMGDLRDMGALLQRAGFALPVADITGFQVTYDSALGLMHDLRSMGETNAMAARRRHPLRRDVLGQVLDHYQNQFAQRGRIPATFELITLTGWAPSEDQPKPLKPGSATNRLSDILKNHSE